MHFMNGTEYRIIYYHEACVFMKLVSCAQFHEIKLMPGTSSAINGTYKTSTMEYIQLYHKL